MSVLPTLIAANIRNGYRNRAAVIVLLAFSIFFIAGFVALVCSLALQALLRSPEPDVAEVARYLALLAYGSGFIAMGMNVNIFTANSLVKEKAQRIHESILGGPVSEREFWMAKSLAIFLPGLAFSLLVSLAVLFGVDALIIAPRMGSLVSPFILFNGIALIPIMYFPLCCIVLFVSLVGNPVNGTVISNIAFSGLITVAINLVTRAGLDPGSLAFALGSLAVSLILGLLALALQTRLGKERIVLSCRS
jgi:hypothetical protein